jgi:hypothetical protein
VSDSNVIKLAQPGAFTDSLAEILRSGARALLRTRVWREGIKTPARDKFEIAFDQGEVRSFLTGVALD